MSVLSKLINCPPYELTFDMWLKLVTYVDAEGNTGINVVYTNRDPENCPDPAFECLQDATLYDVLELITVLDECDNPAIAVMANVCQECNPQYVPGGGPR